MPAEDLVHYPNLSQGEQYEALMDYELQEQVDQEVGYLQWRANQRGDIDSAHDPQLDPLADPEASRTSTPPPSPTRFIRSADELSKEQRLRDLVETSTLRMHYEQGLTALTLAEYPGQ